MKEKENNTMREIKFRGKSTHSDTWCYGSFVGGNDEPTICGFDIWHTGKYEWQEEKIELYSVGQFTGLHDADGKEIYEGDILHITSERGYFAYPMPEYSYVAYATPSFALGIEGSQWLYDMRIPLIDPDVQIRVIGNIHDNKELLKGNKQ